MNTVQLPQLTTLHKSLINQIALCPFTLELPLIEHNISLGLTTQNKSATVPLMVLTFDCSGTTAEVAIDKKGAELLLPFITKLSNLPQPLLHAHILKRLDPTLTYFETQYDITLTLKHVDIITPAISLPIVLTLQLDNIDSSTSCQLALNEDGAQRVLDTYHSIAVEAASTFRDQHCDYSCLPVPVEFLIGMSDINITQVQTLEPQDVVLFDRHYCDKQQLIVRIAHKTLYLAELNQTTAITLLQPMEHTMTNNNSFDSNQQVPGVDTQPDNATDLTDMPIQLEFFLAEHTITLGEMQQLTPGFIFDLGLDLSASAMIKANGKTIGTGQLVEVDKRVGVQIKELYLTKGQSL